MAGPKRQKAPREVIAPAIAVALGLTSQNNSVRPLIFVHRIALVCAIATPFFGQNPARAPPSLQGGVSGGPWSPPMDSVRLTEWEYDDNFSGCEGIFFEKVERKGVLIANTASFQR